MFVRILNTDETIKKNNPSMYDFILYRIYESILKNVFTGFLADCFSNNSL